MSPNRGQKMRVPHQLLMKCKAGQKNHIAGQKFKIAGHYLDVKILFGGQPTLMVNKCPGRRTRAAKTCRREPDGAENRGVLGEFCTDIFFCPRFVPENFWP